VAEYPAHDESKVEGGMGGRLRREGVLGVLGKWTFEGTVSLKRIRTRFP
jgi:hypothetical protein